MTTRKSIERGETIAAPLKETGVFPGMVVQMIGVGEATGALDTMLSKIADFYEDEVDTAVAGLLTLLEPVMIAFLGVVVGGIVIALSNNLVRFMPFLVVLFVGGSYALRQYYATEKGRRVVDGLLLKVPILGSILRKIAVARFCRTLSTLMASGVPILDGLDITARTSGNAIIEDAIQVTRKSIERGETISAPLKETGVFPGMVVQMISVGEATGALDNMLSKIADFYEEEVDTAVAGMLTLLEPVMIAFLGGVVGGIVIAMYLPIFGLISKMAGG